MLLFVVGIALSMPFIQTKIAQYFLPTVLIAMVLIFIEGVRVSVLEA
jgi:hypothetical protein